MARSEKSVDLRLTLRSPQIAYLEYLSERDIAPVSDILRKVIAGAMQRATILDVPAFAKKYVRHLCLEPEHIAFLDRLALIRGIDRSEVARQLIDEERSMDFTL